MHIGGRGRSEILSQNNAIKDKKGTPLDFLTTSTTSLKKFFPKPQGSPQPPWISNYCASMQLYDLPYKYLKKFNLSQGFVEPLPIFYLDDVSHESGLVESLAGDSDGDVALCRVVGPHEVQLLLHVLQLTLVLKTNRLRGLRFKI